MGKLTSKTVGALVAKNEPAMVGDGGGLWLQIRPPGGRSWILRATVHGKARHIGLGSVDLFSLAEARQEAIRMRKVIAQGGDPIAERRRVVPTFEEVARQVFETLTKSWKNDKHRAGWIGSMENHVFPAIGDRPVNTISTADVFAVLSKIWHDKAETARRVKQRMCVVFKRALTDGHMSGDNPAENIDTSVLGAQGDKVEHFDSLPYQELPSFTAKLMARDAMTAKALMFQIFTCVRPSEALGARWSEIDLDGRVWTIPGPRMKGRKGKTEDHRVPLSEAAMALLKAVKNEGFGGDLVFPARPGKDGKESELSNGAVRALYRRMGLGGITSHGFRTTFRTWVQEEMPHVPHEVAEACLAHKVGNGVSQSYARSDVFEQRRRIMERWGDFATGVQSEAEVVILHGTGA